jgi:tryptophan synthase alpha subunit
MTAAERLTAALRSARPGGLPALVPYITAGFPRRDDTVAVLRAAQDAGCTAAEIGVPFSDPLADGPTVQRAGWQSLRNGMTTALAIAKVADARAAGVTIPLAFMTYINPVLSHGLDRFCADAAAAGVDGVIAPDLPADEAAGLREASTAHGLALIPLVAPTTPPARIEAVTRHASGFIYCVGVVGTTGARAQIAPEAFELLDRVRACTPLPRAIGFGLSRHEHLVALRGRCEGAVVGSALLDAMFACQDDGAAAASKFLHGMLNAA